MDVLHRARDNVGGIAQNLCNNNNVGLKIISILFVLIVFMLIGYLVTKMVKHFA